MSDLINKLEAMAQTGSLKQNTLNDLISQQGMSSKDCLALLKKSQEQVSLLLPDDDED